MFIQKFISSVYKFCQIQRRVNSQQYIFKYVWKDFKPSMSMFAWRTFFRLILVISVFTLSNSAEEQVLSKAPFIDPNTIHPTRSQFEFNLILNENRNLPIFFLQYSKDFSRQTVLGMLKGAFSKQPGVAFALLIDCRKFQYDMNNTLRICNGFDPEKAIEQEKSDLQISPDKRQDKFFRFDFLAPNPSRIKQKGHELSKNHDSRNLREMNNLFNDQFLAKVIRNEIPDFVSYIEDQYDMQQFLGKKSSFKSAKKAKILFFDQNMQAPLFLKKLSALMDGKIKIGVTDNFKAAKKYEIFYDSILLMEYNFVTNDYQTLKIQFEEGKQLDSILKNQRIRKYLEIKRYRDVLLDFQHKNSVVYSMASLSQINQLMSHGRIIVLQISESETKFECSSLRQISQKYDVFLNYICFSRKQVSLLVQAGLKVEQSLGNVYIIDQTLTNFTKVAYEAQSFNVYEYLPQTPPRQKISVQSQAQMCLKTAFASRRDPVIYWYNQKQHKNTLRLLQYFNSLTEVNSLIYFCQIYVPDKDVIEKYQLNENCLFSMINPNNQGQMQKLQFKQALEFVSIKMFLRQLSINQMLKVYEEKLSSNSLTEIKTAQKLTDQCFNKDCIIALMATNKFRFQSQTQILKQIKIEMSDSGYNFVWIDGHCHWDVAKQLKFLDKKQKEIDRTYIFYYKQKTNQYGLMENIQENKYWVKKDIKKWLKKLKQSNNIKRLKFGIDIEEKKCQQIIDSSKQANKQGKGRGKQIKQNLKQGQL